MTAVTARLWTSLGALGWLWSATGALAAEFYVAPNGRPAGNGSMEAPWDLATVLAHPKAVKPMDTIWLRGGGPPEAALAHRVACALIRLQTAAGRLPQTLQELARHLASFRPSPPPVPRSFDELCRIVEQVEEVEGVRFRELFTRLPATHAATGDEALQKVLELARPQ